MSCGKSRTSSSEKSVSPEEQQAKKRKLGATSCPCIKRIDVVFTHRSDINVVRRALGPVAQKVPVLCSDASVLRYLKARNWSTKKACKMFEESLKWRLQYKPEKIRWEDIAQVAEAGKVYRANYCDKFGRAVLIMRPGFESSSSTELQMKYLVYCMENAIMHLNPDKEQMVWLIDFQGWTMSSISVKVTRETANILQNHYPERLGLAILYNPPKVFESFWVLVKPFLEPKTYKKVRFAYSDDLQSRKIMEALFDMDKLESAFGGRNTAGFDYEAYAQRMREDDNKKSNAINSGCCSPINQSSLASKSQQSDSPVSERLSSASDLCSEPSDESSSVEELASNMEISDESEQMPPTLGCEDIPMIEAAVTKEVQ